jgi:prevent-host-death family protein
MTKVNIADAKARLAEYIKRVEAGETIILARRNQPVAELRPISMKERSPRPMGLCAGEFQVPPDFDEPLPEDVLKEFEG